MASTSIHDMLVRVGADVGQAMSGLGRVGSKVATVSASITKFGAIGATALLAFVAAATKMAGNFQDKMADVDTMLDGTPGKLEELGAEVKRIAVLVGKPLDDLAGGMYQVVSAFGQGADNAKQLEIAAKAAKAGLASTTDSVNLLSAVTKGYGDTSLEAMKKAADLSFQTVKLGQTTFPELAASMGKAIPLAATLGVKVEDLFGSMATLTGVTGETAEVATQMRATLQALINPTDAMAAKLAKLGFSNGKTMIETLGLQGTLDMLAESTGGNTQQLAKMFGSVEALNAVLALTGAQSEDFTNKTKAMYEATGIADEAFKKKTETVNAMLERLKEMGSVMMVNFGEKFLPALETFGNWVMENMPVIEAVMDAAFDAIGVVLEWLGTVFVWFRDNILAPFVAAWKGDAEAMQTPIGRFATFVKGIWDTVAGYFANFKQNIWEPFVKGWNGGNTEMGSTSERIFGMIGSIMRSLWSIVEGVLSLLTMAWNEFGDEIMAVVKISFETVLGVIDGALKVIDGVIKFFVALFKGDWQGMGDALIQIWEGLWQAITTFLSGVWEVLKTVFGGLYESIEKWFVGLATSAYEWGANLVKGMIDGIKAWIGKALATVSEFANSLADKAKSALGIHSPSRVFAEIGHNIGAGLAVGIDGTANMVNQALAGVAMGDINATVSAGSTGASAGETHMHFAPGAITIPVKDLAELRTVENFFNTLRQHSRALGVGG